MGLRLVMLLFCKALMYFQRFFRRQRFNNEQVDLIFEILMAHCRALRLHHYDPFKDTALFHSKRVVSS